MDVGCERKLAALFLADETRGSGAKLKVCGTVLGGGTSALFSDQYGRAAGATTSDFLFPSVFCPPSSVFATLWQTITFGSKTHLPALSLSMGPSTPLYTKTRGNKGQVGATKKFIIIALVFLMLTLSLPAVSLSNPPVLPLSRVFQLFAIYLWPTPLLA